MNKKLRITNIRMLRKHSIRILNQLLAEENKDDINYEYYKLIDKYFNTIKSIFALESSLKVEINHQIDEITDEQMNDVIDKVKRMILD